ncbi:MAG: PRC-barrel domain-containing protein [Candidatus Gracilibacteria bacterium]|nr:PRC-barrel domain-containing protein [Candidatus Peregrinibacteria bacterium]
MEKYYRQTIGLPVISHSRQPLTRVRDVIIDTDKGKIVGFFVMGGSNHVVAPIDILEWNSVIMINDQEDIIEPDEVHTIREALKKDATIFKKRVYTKSGDYLGKVLDFGMNSQLYELTVIIVSKAFLSLFFWDKKIISSKDIIRIKPDRIIVKDLVQTVPMEKFQVDMASP